MEINVKISKILESERYISKKDGKEYIKHYFLGVTGGDYPKTICFSCMGDKFGTFGLEVGCDYSVSFDVVSREWKGRWFTDVSCWRVVKI